MRQINNWSTPDGALNVTLHQNKLKTGTFYGKVSRRVISLDKIIGMIAKKHPGVGEGLVQLAAGLIQAEILDLLGMGFSVNVLELGTLYLAMSGSVTGSIGERMNITARFTPSQLVLDKVSAVSVEAVSFSSNEPVIEHVVDTMHMDAVDETVTIDRLVRLTGKRLRLGRTERGIYFVPMLGDGSPNMDEATWIAVPEASLVTNLPSKVEFYVPATVSSGAQYAVAVRTMTPNGKSCKSPVTGMSQGIRAKTVA